MAVHECYLIKTEVLNLLVVVYLSLLLQEENLFTVFSHRV